MPRPSSPSPDASSAIEKIQAAAAKAASARALYSLEFTSLELHALSVFIKHRLPIDEHTLRVYCRAHPNHSLSEVARAFGRTHGAIKRAAERCGITFASQAGRR